jgi:hypothetical protein
VLTARGTAAAAAASDVGGSFLRMLQELPKHILKQLLPEILFTVSTVVERPEEKAQLQVLAEHSRSADRLQVYQAASQKAREALVAPTRAQDRLSAPLPDGRIQEVRPQIAPDLASKLRGRWHACAKALFIACCSSLGLLRRAKKRKNKKKIYQMAVTKRAVRTLFCRVVCLVPTRRRWRRMMMRRRRTRRQGR